MPSNGIQTQMSLAMLVETMCSHLFCVVSPMGLGPMLVLCSAGVFAASCSLLHQKEGWSGHLGLGCFVCCSAVIPLLRGHSPNTTPAESPPQPSRGVGTPGTTLWLGRLGHKGCPQVVWCPTGPTAWPTGFLLPKGLAIKL